jgi:RNA polymerase sigma-70 factor (ECF subfamily)
MPHSRETSLVSALRAARPDLSCDAPELESRLEAWAAAARGHGVEVAPEDFIAHAATRIVQPRGDVVAAFERACLPDLYLACACVRGAPGAIEAFERAFGGEVDRAVRRAPSARVAADDVRQVLRERIFVSKGSAAPKIAEYAGRGALRIWVRVAISRIVQNMATRGPRESPLGGELLAELPAVTGDPQLDHMRALYRDPFKAAFAAALDALPLNDRVLLRQRFVAHKSQEELAGSYGVHVNTIARWLSRARQAVETRTREELATRLGGEGDFTSVLRLIRSEIDLTLGTET